MSENSCGCLPGPIFQGTCIPRHVITESKAVMSENSGNGLPGPRT